jgi:hypothetical protein
MLIELTCRQTWPKPSVAQAASTSDLKPSKRVSEPLGIG